MIKRLLMFWLVICTAGYGVAWAFDGHVDERAEHHHRAGDPHQGAGAGEDHPACDHCCHATAHMTALWSSPADRLLPGTDIGHTPYPQAFFFNASSPPERPPRTES